MNIFTILENIYNNAYDQVSTAMQNETLMGMTVLGFVTAILTTVLYKLRQIPSKIRQLITRYWTINITINQGDHKYYPIIKKWYNIHHKSTWGSFITAEYGTFEKPIPAGLRFHRIGFNLLFINIVQRELDHGGNNAAVTSTIHINMIGFQRRKILDNFIKEAVEDYEKDNELYINYLNTGGGHERFGPLPSKDTSRIITNHTNEIITDLELFLKSGDWYKDKGIPYRRGMALIGPPGTGKTSMAISIANYIRRSLVVINLQSLDSKALMRGFAHNDQLFLIEDIDTYSITKDRKIPQIINSNNDNKKQERLSLSDVLNAIDGPTSGSGNILIITTNHMNHLDHALLRPGRIDKVYELGYLTQDLFNKMCMLYYGRLSMIKIPENISAAKVQELFIQNRQNFEDFQEAVQNLGEKEELELVCDYGS